MAFPTSPSDGQVATVNGIRYTYASSSNSWTRSPAGSAVLSVISDEFVGDGSTISFTLSNTPLSSDMVTCIVDGVPQLRASFTVSGNIVTFTGTPANGALIEVRTMQATGLGVLTGLVYNTFTGDGSTTSFTLSTSPTNKNFTIVSVNGTIIAKSAYSVSGTTLTFTSAPASSAVIEATTLGPAVSNAPAGGNTQVQYNNNGAVAGSSSLTFNNTSNILTAGNLVVSANSTTTNLVATLANITTGNITTLTSGTANITTGNITTLTGTTGTFGNLTVSGNVTAGALSVPQMTFTGTINVPNTFGFKNRLINGQFQVAQRATTGTSGSGLPTTTATYPSLDRWFAYGTGATVAFAQVSGSGNIKNLAQITGASSVTAAGIGQRIEAVNCYDLIGQTVTLSAYIADSTLTTVNWTVYYAGSTDVWTTSTQIATGSWSVTSTLTQYSAQISIPSAATTGLQVVFSVGAQTSGTLQIGNAQLELGSQVTSFDTRDYGRELILCQRYYYQWQALSGYYTTFCNVFGISTTNGYGVFKLPVTMRTPPALTTTGTASNYRIFIGGSTYNCSSVPTMDTSGVDTVALQFPTAGSFTAGYAGFMQAASTLGVAFLGFSSEV